MKSIYCSEIGLKYANLVADEMKKDAAKLIAHNQFDECRSLLYDLDSLMNKIRMAEEEGDEE